MKSSKAGLLNGPHVGLKHFGIERTTCAAALDQANANIAARQATLLQAYQEYGRKSAVREQAVAPVASVEDAKAKLDRALAAIGGARAAIETAEINLGYTEVLAPFENAVTNHLVDVGDLIGDGGPAPHAGTEKVEQFFLDMLYAFP